MRNTSTELEIIGEYHILGEWYQAGKDDEGCYTLLDEDGDEISEPMELDYQGTDTDEIICELYLCHYESYQYKHSDFTCKEWLQAFEKCYDRGRRAGRKEQMKLIIEDLENDLEDM